ncbi:MAG: Gfo/Idh/MocA family oxidoreductase [Ruminococcaceae bacterium]|nr:Gfo/Idh/MocA family oxidoreductase [Oscillospiraceae bacterium]
MDKRIIKIGIFGVFRGAAFYNSFLANNAEIIAVCDMNKKRTDAARSVLGEGLAVYDDFDRFIEHEGLEAIMLCNYFYEHAEYAIKALEKGISVLSECTSNATMADGVALVRAAEKSKGVYMLSENYPFIASNREMRNVYRGGSLGKIIFGEGEYNHPIDPADLYVHKDLIPSSKHWRYDTPRTYYITHSLAPLMYITGVHPVRVIAVPAFGADRGVSCGKDAEGKIKVYYGPSEKAAIITCINNDGSVYRVTGCSTFGADESTYRICCDNGQMESLRDGSGRVCLAYNHWQIPKGKNQIQCYFPDTLDKDDKLAEQFGHGGGDFFVVREFLDCIREGRQPEFDVYFATTMASVAILGHRSLLEGGVPYDLPDFRKEEERLKYENDRLTPFYGADGSEPTIASSARPDMCMTPEGRTKYDKLMQEI